MAFVSLWRGSARPDRRASQRGSGGGVEAAVHMERIQERLGFAEISGVATLCEPGQNWVQHAPRLLAAGPGPARAVTSAPGGFLELLGVPGGAVSENGCLCQREEGHGGGSRRRSVLMFPTLSAAAGSTGSG